MSVCMHVYASNIRSALVKDKIITARKQPGVCVSVSMHVFASNNRSALVKDKIITARKQPGVCVCL